MRLDVFGSPAVGESSNDGINTVADLSSCTLAVDRRHEVKWQAQQKIGFEVGLFNLDW
jgi:hypothetical protein